MRGGRIRNVTPAWLLLVAALALADGWRAGAATAAVRVRFRFQGRHGSLVTAGTICGAMRIERLDAGKAGPIALAIGPQCICECAPIPAPRLQRAVPLASSPVLEWDAREGEERARPARCAQHASGARPAQ